MMSTVFLGIIAFALMFRPDPKVHCAVCCPHKQRIKEATRGQY